MSYKSELMQQVFTFFFFKRQLDDLKDVIISLEYILKQLIKKDNQLGWMILKDQLQKLAGQFLV